MMNSRARLITEIALLAAVISITGMIKIPLGFPGTEFQFSAPVAVVIMSVFGFKKYFTAGVISSTILFLLGMHNIINVAVAMIFRLVVGAIIAGFGRNIIAISISGPIAVLTSRFILSKVLGVPYITLILGSLPGIVITLLISYPMYKVVLKTLEGRKVVAVE
ncbi:hypothetical protein [Lysinibacillus sp. LZ02]|uniref:hypothetical protein n=1 Tax=Lysinibacillus sp. LZ02 TaxID=3420668 RepID=UPI003D36F36C